MGNIWVINKGKREQVETKVGDILRDANKWKLITLYGVETFKTKKAAIEWKTVFKI